jgi:hypothetical protein
LSLTAIARKIETSKLRSHIHLITNPTTINIESGINPFMEPVVLHPIAMVIYLPLTRYGLPY